MKRFLRSLSRKDISRYLILLLLATSGIWIKGYVGGCITGAASICLVLAIIGKRLAQTAISRIDKQVKDIIVNNSN